MDSIYSHFLINSNVREGFETLLKFLGGIESTYTIGPQEKSEGLRFLSSSIIFASSSSEIEDLIFILLVSIAYVALLSANLRNKKLLDKQFTNIFNFYFIFQYCLRRIDYTKYKTNTLKGFPY